MRIEGRWGRFARFTQCFLCGLAALAQTPELVVQTGHFGTISALAFSPDSRILASASHDRTLVLWDMETRSQIRTMKGHTHKATSVAFGDGGRMLASGGCDGTARIWDPATGRLVRTIQAHELAVDTITLRADGRLLATGSFDGSIKLWDPATGRERHTLEGHAGGVAAIAFSPDGRTLASGSHDHSVRLWDPATGELRKVLEGHPVAVMGVAFSADGRQLASSGGGIAGRGVVCVWDASTGERLHRFETNDEWISSVAFTRDGTHLVGGTNTRNRALHLWNLRTGTDEGKLATRTGSVHALAFSPNGRQLAYGCDSNAIGLRAPGNWGDLGQLTGRVHAISSVAWSPDGEFLATGGRSREIELLDLSRSGEARKLSGHENDVNAVAFSPDGGRLASASYDRTVRVWETAHGRPLLTLKGHASPVKCVAWSPDGGLLASGSWDNTVRLWEASTGAQRLVLEGHLDFVRDVAFSPDGRTLASASGDMTVRLWDVASGRSLGTLEGHTNWVEALAFSPDGRLLASGSVDRTLKLWDIATRKVIRTLEGHTAAVSSLLFLEKGTRLASTGYDRTLRIWDVASGRELSLLEGHNDAVLSLAKGWNETLASGGQDAQVRFWSPASSKALASLALLGGRDWAVVDPQGRFDTNTLEDVQALRWVMPDDPFRPLPVEIFMRDYYEPRLLPRLLNGERLGTVRNLQDVNRAQPKVAIDRIRLQDADRVAVDVTLARARTTDAFDLRLFRNGQLVAVSARRGDPASASDLAGWRRIHRVGPSRLSFTGIRLPHASGPVEFSAYAFNEDRVKSLTARKTFQPPELPEVKGVAYLITLGVNDSDRPEWRLKFAANDARRLRQSLADRLGRNPAYRAVVSLALVSDRARREDEAPAFKANLKTLLDLLAGRTVGAPARARIPGADRIQPATPEDLVLIAFSGHGYAGDHGVFYLLPEDVGHSRNEAELLKRCISSEDLSEWLRDVDAGDMAMVVDACHSAASVQGEGFKPGPMGSRGLGQLAFDKGMRILTSSQADTASLESDKLQQGLLSYALVRDGLERREADYFPKDGVIALSEWLAYGTQRVPLLNADVLAGRVRGVRGINLTGAATAARRVLQQPALFDFKRRPDDVRLEGP